jgi:hypothetical protein
VPSHKNPEVALLPALNFFGCSIRPLTLLAGRSGPDLYAGDGLLMFWSHQPIAPWQTQAWIAEMRRSLRPNQYCA